MVNYIREEEYESIYKGNIFAQIIPGSIHKNILQFIPGSIHKNILQFKLILINTGFYNSDYS